MKNQFMMAVLAAAALLASCAKDAGTDPVPVPGVPDAIRATAKSLTIETSTMPGSKAAYTAANADGLKAAVYGSLTTGNYASTYVSGTMTFKAGTGSGDAVAFDAGATGSTSLPADKSSVFLTALYPADGVTWSALGATATVTFTGKEDIMASSQSEVAKDGGSGGKAAFGTFAFKHLLTRIDVTIKGEDESAVAAWGEVQSVKLTQVKGSATFSNQAAITLADGTAAIGSAFSGSASGWSFYTDADATPASKALTTSQVAYATTMMAPFTAANSDDLTLEIVTKTASGSAVTSTVNVKVPTDGGADTQGKAYSINLVFKKADISGIATVQGWGTPVDIEQPVI